MKHIDLVQFAEHSQKLPAQMLLPATGKEKVSHWKIFCAHLIDFFLIFSLTSVITTIFTHSVKIILVTKSLQSALNHLDFMSLSKLALPLTVFSYFFFCYFMNHGQTYGMKIMKNRIEMKSKHYWDAFEWAARSLFLCFSCGLSFFISHKKWQSMKNHDYLYLNLLAHKEFQTVNICESKKEKLHEEDFNKAA